MGLLVLAVACVNASKFWFPCVFKQKRRKALSPVSNSKEIKGAKTYQMRPNGTNLSPHMLVDIGKFLPPGDLVGKMPGTCKQWSKVNWKLLLQFEINGATYENVTPTNDPIAVFKKIDEEKFFLEDPKNLLDRAINRYKYGDCPTIDFSTATWGNLFEYSIDMRYSLRFDSFNPYSLKMQQNL